MRRTGSGRSHWILDRLLSLDLLTRRVTAPVDHRWPWLLWISATVAKENLVSWEELVD